MAVNLENLDGLPQEFVKQLSAFDHVFRSCNYFEEVKEYFGIMQLTADIDSYCAKHKIIGFHYTNAIKEDILEHGLLVRTGEEIRKSFVERHFHLFTKEEQTTILTTWEAFFSKPKAKVRDKRLFLNFTQDGLENGGTNLLLNFYGGEQVYFPIFSLPQIGAKLKLIGTPMMLKCILNPSDLVTYLGFPGLYEHPWGRIAVSSYHRLKNRNACVEDQDGYQEVGVSPENIEIVICKKPSINI